jgi:hypothetical protein
MLHCRNTVLHCIAILHYTVSNSCHRSYSPRKYTSQNPLHCMGYNTILIETPATLYTKTKMNNKINPPSPCLMFGEMTPATMNTVRGKHASLARRNKFHATRNTDPAARNRPQLHGTQVANSRSVSTRCMVQHR